MNGIIFMTVAAIPAICCVAEVKEESWINALICGTLAAMLNSCGLYLLLTP